MISIVDNLGQGIGLLLGPLIFLLCKSDIERLLWTLVTLCILWSVTMLAFLQKESKMQILSNLMEEEINIPLSSVASLSENRASEAPIAKPKFEQADKLL